MTDGGEPTVYHVVCRDCGKFEEIYESQIRAGLEMGKHILTTGHRVVVEEVAAE
ncbi:MAG: hypothetical protein ABEJ81_02470 [Haloferacaceae archaeon]